MQHPIVPSFDTLLSSSIDLHAPYPEEAAAWAPLPPPWSECRRNGDLLVAPRESMLPPRCVKCGANATERRTVKIYWHSRWWYLLILFHLAAYLIAALAIRQKAVLDVGLCERHARRRRRLRLAGAIVMLGGVGVSFIAFPLGLVAGIVMLCIGTLVVIGGSRLVTARRMNDQFVWLGGVHPSIVRAHRPHD